MNLLKKLGDLIMNREIWIKKIKYIEGIKNNELIKFESYSLIIDFILSKEEFKYNADVAEFLNSLNIVFKPYLIKSRTAMVARLVRILRGAEKEEILQFVALMKERLLDTKEEVPDKSKEKKSKENYMKKMLDIYGRKDSKS